MWWCSKQAEKIEQITDDLSDPPCEQEQARSKGVMDYRHRMNVPRYEDSGHHLETSQNWIGPHNTSGCIENLEETLANCY